MQHDDNGDNEDHKAIMNNNKTSYLEVQIKINKGREDPKFREKSILSFLFLIHLL